jgi:type II secretory pathway pseudopilin PulG
MCFKTAQFQASAIKRACRAFTLAEVLAAMLFMAIVIPVALQGLHVASVAGEAGQRKLVAARLGDKVMNELKVTGQLQNAGQSGQVTEGGVNYRWSVRSELWPEDTTTRMNLVTLTISFPAQGKNYDVKLSTLVPQSTTL